MARGGEAQAEREGRRSFLTTPLVVTLSAEWLAWAAVAVGVALRLLAFASGRPLYRDERSLLENLVALPVFDFRTTLTEYQLAPPGFLAIERMLVRLPGCSARAGGPRPSLAGLRIASIFLFRLAGAEVPLLPHAVPIAVGLFALSDWLIYYSSEMKQYSCDLALTLTALLCPLRPRLVIAGSPGSKRPAMNPVDAAAPVPGRPGGRRRLVFPPAGAFVLAGSGRTSH